jgi:hypothetical protein
MATTNVRVLPAWADELRRRYIRGEATLFVLHGNVYDLVVYDKKFLSLTEFLAEALLGDAKDTVAVYNIATGVRFTKKKEISPIVEELLLSGGRDKALPALERLLTMGKNTALVVEYAERSRPAATRSGRRGSRRDHNSTAGPRCRDQARRDTWWCSSPRTSRSCRPRSSRTPRSRSSRSPCPTSRPARRRRSSRIPVSPRRTPSAMPR